MLYGSIVHTHLCIYAYTIRAILNFRGCEEVLLQVHKHLSSVPAHWKSCKSTLPRHPPKLNGTHTGLTSSAETMHTHKSSPTMCRSTTDLSRHLGRGIGNAPHVNAGRPSLLAAQTKGRPRSKPPETLLNQAIPMLFPVC